MNRFVFAPLVLAAVACGGSDSAAPDAASATMRDSAGVSIIESHSPLLAGEKAVSLGAEPTVTIGETVGAPEYQLYQVRAATRLPDGGVALFDGGSQELRYYDATGTFVRRVGGKGGGPGEYQGVSWMVRLPGDSIMLHDLQAQRITVVAPDGSMARSVNLAQPAPPPAAPAGNNERQVRIGGAGMYQVVGVMSDGSFLARARGEAAPPGAGAAVTRDSVTYVRLTAEGKLRDTVGLMIGDERTISMSGDSQRRVVTVSAPPFGRGAQVAMDADGFWFGSGDSYDIVHRTPTGQIDRIVRRPVEPLPVTPEVIAAGKKAELARPMQGPAELKGVLQKMIEDKWATATMPATMPAHGRLLTDAANRLWVAETTLPDDDVARWTAFGTDGRMLGTVTMPASFRALEFGPDYVLGVATDEDEVERVELYPLTVPTP